MSLADLIHSGTEDGLKACLDSESNPLELLKKLGEVDPFQKTNIELLVILNKQEYVEKAIATGYDVNTAGKNGYTMLHYAAMWNRPLLIRYLYFSNVELFAKNQQGETPHDMALKYGQKDADIVLQWAKCRQEFIRLIEHTREMIAVTDKSEYSKEEKKLIESACVDGENWINKNKEATLSALRTKKEHIELIVEPLFRTKSPK
ncbi:Ankyrin repeat domain-containing protein 45 [Paragonimus westermani]|uniref:Ankyrin repeat domain-containing protein 45 n=1 Tax=Paragonimus westermani TaxID=34504 RepID=A0A8T0DQ47_9TREM|nr:Ankyrin repeat domain-containing protein 45 [Paragonimus westermani]